MNLSMVDNSPWTLLANVFYVKVFMIFNADVVFLSIARIKFCILWAWLIGSCYAHLSGKVKDGKRGFIRMDAIYVLIPMSIIFQKVALLGWLLLQLLGGKLTATPC